MSQLYQRHFLRLLDFSLPKSIICLPFQLN